MKAPRLRKIDDTQDMGQLIRQLNELVLDLQDLGNSNSSICTIVVTAPVTPGSFPHNLAAKPVAVNVVGVEDLTHPSATVTTAPFVQWALDDTGKKVRVRAITGLTSGHQYRIKFRVESE